MNMLIDVAATLTESRALWIPQSFLLLSAQFAERTRDDDLLVAEIHRNLNDMFPKLFESVMYSQLCLRIPVPQD